VSLKEYARKRNFQKTAEPKGSIEKVSQNRFVIQKHEASHLHYDFRLEMDGTLKSWAVPKGVPYTKGEKRLAMEVEDHPVSYIGFEGTIPKGQYGGGTVMVWDQGTYEPLSKSPSAELASGKLHFVLHGKKLNGEWYLVRLREGNQWLLIKGGANAKKLSAKMDDTSALSGRGMKAIAGGDHVWQSNRAVKQTSKPAKKATSDKPATQKPAKHSTGRSSTQLKVAGKTLDVTNLHKIFYPKTGFTKGDLIDYYIRISPHLLPHLKNRPITLKRYPNGVEGLFFYEKQCPKPHPSWIKTTDVKRSDETTIHYLLINDLPTLVWAANLADLELHTFLHKAPAILRPNFLAFDLDPGPPADIIQCCEVGLRLKALFDALKLKSFAKTSGSKGLQVYVPLNSPTMTYEKTKAFAHSVAQALEKQHPDLVVEKMFKKLRNGKVLLDWSQNDDHKTTVSVYSLRAKERPTVSTPVSWDEVATAHKKKNPKLLTFEAKDVLKRVETLGDLFAPVLKLKQKLPAFDAASLD
jgi:bifunctional non-homologous end joining protein LigD